MAKTEVKFGVMINGFVSEFTIFNEPEVMVYDTKEKAEEIKKHLIDNNLVDEDKLSIEKVNVHTQ